HPSAKYFSTCHRDLDNARPFLFKRSEALVEINRHFRFVEHLEENVLGNVRFESPHGFERLWIGGRRLGTVALAKIGLARFKTPGCVLGIVLRDTRIKLTRNPAYSRFVADIGGAESA